MKKLLSIFLFCQIISNNVFAEELIRIPNLFAHYSHHSREHKDVTDFIDFINMHYGDNSGHETGDDDDEKLPFRHDDNCVNSHVTCSVALPATTHFIAPEQVPGIVVACKGKNIQSLQISKIWQPPREK